LHGPRAGGERDGTIGTSPGQASSEPLTELLAAVRSEVRDTRGFDGLLPLTGVERLYTTIIDLSDVEFRIE
jgi:hypothetical protein